jgi:hypothetical protein
MRSRSLNTVVTVSGLGDYTWYLPTTEDGPSGPRSVLPFVYQASGSDPVFYSKQEGIQSSIDDEIPHFKRVGSVAHLKRTLMAPTPVLSWSKQNLEFARNSYNSTNGVVQSRRSYLDDRDWVNAVSWAGPWGAGSVASASASSICPAGRSDDRLSELVPRLMNQINRLSVANTIWESREIPTLVKMFKRREALARSLESVYAWYSQRGPKGFKVGKQDFVNAARAFREGNLNWFFGIAPTWGDVKNINKELRKPRSFRKNVTATVRDYESFPVSKTGTDSNGGRRSFVLSRSRTRVFGARLTFNGNQEPFMTEFFQKWQSLEDRFTGANPLATIWEAIPFSFAVDWLLSIDNLLDALWLNNQPRHSVSYWISKKDVLETNLQWQYMTEIRGEGNSSLVPTPTFADAGPQIERLSYYTRQPSAPPSALSQVKARGGTKQLYLLTLIALGLRGPLSGSTAR